jgi:Protein kinase domain
MSAVYRAYDTVMGRDVALKRLLPIEETNLNESAGESLAREAAALARFSHANVVTVFAFEEDSEGPFVVMELVEGEDLHSIMKSGALSWEDFRDVAGQCLEPLVAAAELNLLHRDIKPGNIMLTVTASGRFLVKLLDFGLAKFSQQPSLQTLDQRGSFLGSIDFIAPEQLELRPLDQRTDLYSLGCVFYYMLVQESPFTGGNPAETSMNHIKHRCQHIAERRSDLPPLVADWLMRLISRDPDDRPNDARDALRQFQEALKGIPYVPVAKRADAEDIPFARVIGPAPTGPVGPPPPSGPVGPPTGAVPATRVIQTASGPIPAARKVTGPVTGAQIPSLKTARQPLLPPNATGSIRGSMTGPARPTTRSVAPTNERKKEAPRGKGAPRGFLEFWDSLTLAGKSIVAGVPALLVLVGLFFVLRGDSEGDSATPSGGADGVGAKVPTPEVLAPLPHPVAVSSADGAPALPPLPAAASIKAWFSGAKAALGRDYRTPASPGEQVAAWVNLVATPKEQSLLRDGGDPKGEHLPRLVENSASQVAGIRGTQRGLTTTNRSSLSMLKHEVALSKGATVVVVAEIEAGDDRVYRFQAPTWDNRYFQLTTGYDGKINAVSRGRTEGPEERISIPWKSGDLGILVHRWNPGGGEQRLSALSATPASHLVEAKGTIKFTGAPLGIMSLGKRGFGDSYDAVTNNVIYEAVVYDRVLSDAEVKEVTAALAKRYFASAP